MGGIAFPERAQGRNLSQYEYVYYLLGMIKHCMSILWSESLIVVVGIIIAKDGFENLL